MSRVNEPKIVRVFKEGSSMATIAVLNRLSYHHIEETIRRYMLRKDRAKSASRRQGNPVA